MLGVIKTLSVLAVLAAGPFSCGSGGGAAGTSKATSVGEPTAATDGSPDSSPGPHGGTPEPSTLLLIGGSAAGYLVLRRRRKRGGEAAAAHGHGDV